MIRFIIFFLLVLITAIGIVFIFRRRKKTVRSQATRDYKTTLVDPVTNKSVIVDSAAPLDISDPLEITVQTALINEDSSDTLNHKAVSTELLGPSKPAFEKNESVIADHPVFISIHIIPLAGKVYQGYELLEAIAANCLYYGSNKLFHRYEQGNGQGAVLFSLASIHQPGIFELHQMGHYSCPGLTLFMVLGQKCSSHLDALSIFDLMLQTAKQLTNDLGGSLLDDKCCALTDDVIVHIQDRIQSFETSKQSLDLFDTQIVN